MPIFQELAGWRSSDATANLTVSYNVQHTETESRMEP